MNHRYQLLKKGAASALLIAGIVMVTYSIYKLAVLIQYSWLAPWHVPCHERTKTGDNHILINDASCLNETKVLQIVDVKNIDDIKQALQKAREQHKKIVAAGLRHSMGGQALFADAIVLDMTSFNKILHLDRAQKLLIVEPGATWHQIQEYINPVGLAVKAMQSTDIFTVGGSISVNAHGMDHTAGSLANTIKSMNVMLADGSIMVVSPSENVELFQAIVGGYGLFGIITQVTLQLTDNELYELNPELIDYKEFPQKLSSILADLAYKLFYGHLSTSPTTLLHEMIIYPYKKIHSTLSSEEMSLGDMSHIPARRFILNLTKKRDYAKKLKWWFEKNVKPHASEQENHIARNAVMHDSVEYLQSMVSGQTDILHEYYVPLEQFIPFIDGVRACFLQHPDLVLLNASVRIVKRQDNFLNYAPQDMIALVLYINQKRTPQGNKSMEQLTHELIDVAHAHGGTFFLPYQLYYTKDQLRGAYPMVDEFFTLKKKYDPQELFMNMWYQKYAK